MFCVLEGSTNPCLPGLWAVFDVASGIFALAFYLFVAGLGLYGMASVVYNMALARRRRREERPEPPTARRSETVYPDREGAGKA